MLLQRTGVLLLAPMWGVSAVTPDSGDLTPSFVFLNNAFVSACTHMYVHTHIHTYTLKGF